jgi:hypothetical protein
MMELWLVLGAAVFACVLFAAWRWRRATTRPDADVVSQQWLVAHRAEER